MATEPVYRGAWPRIRRTILDRDGHRCQIKLVGCLGAASCVDHIVPTLLGGAWYDPDNLRAACAPCNSKLARRGARRPAPSRPSREWL